jgi:D-glycero-D-manno-heptose 1,7-bisphosphate phosphatase
MVNKAAFLDRDGTIARDVHYCRRVEDFEILAGVPEAIRLLNEDGYKVVVITNQSGIARGYFAEDTLAEIHQKMKDELAGYGARIDEIYYCPHHPDDGCACRKPMPGLILRAAADLGISLELSYFIGDMMLDVAAGKAAGCKTVLLDTGPSRPAAEAGKATPDFMASNLLEAVRWITDRNK